MRRGLILATAIVGISFPACAQQGSDIPQGSQRDRPFPHRGLIGDPHFQKSVSPTESNPTNWAKPPPQQDPSYGINPRAQYWGPTERAGEYKSVAAFIVCGFWQLGDVRRNPRRLAVGFDPKSNFQSSHCGSNHARAFLEFGWQL